MSKIKILVVEDEMIIARELATQLRKLGYEPVGQASTGADSIKLVGSLQPDLVLMDIQLAGAMDGIAAAQLIRDQYDLPVIYVTAFATDEVMNRAKVTEPYGYILKPFSARELHTVIEMALYKHKTDRILRQNMLSLRSAAQHTQAILDNMVDAVITINEMGIMESFNLAASHIFGYSPQEAIGCNVSILMPDARRLAHDGYLAHYRATGEARIIGKPRELEGRRKDGSIFPMALSISRITSDDKSIFVGLVHDISERRAAEAQIRKLSLAVEQSPEMIVITDLDGSIEYVNAAYLEQTGFSKEEVIGKNPAIVQSGKTPPEVYEQMWQTLRSGAIWAGELQNRRKDGSLYINAATIAPLRQEDGRITHYVAVQQDVTEKKRQERELTRHREHLEELVTSRTAELTVARQQAETANLAKSAFLANMSHEIRTPMNAILGMTYLVQRDLEAPAQIGRLNTIQNAGRHLLGIINDILDLSKIESGKFQLENIDFHLSDILDAAAAITQDSAQKKGLKLTVDYGNVPQWLHGDPMRLRQAVLNYLSNAIKFTATGVIHLRVVLLQEAADGLQLRFDVQDSGIGLSAEQTGRLFNPFEQADVAITRKYGGTGLGLAITQRLAGLMQGTVGIESALGVGSTFWFTARVQHGHGGLPGSAPETGPGVLATLQNQHRGARLLLVEDDLFNREIALEVLQETGLVVDAAEDGLVALEKVRAHRYDLILMDMQMPKLDGLAATREIRTLSTCQSIPIIAMTANAFDEDKQACAAAGMNDFISKPVEPSQLFAIILKWLRHKYGNKNSAPIPTTEGPFAAKGGEPTALLLNTLGGLLEAHDISAISFFTEQDELLAAPLGEHFDDIARHIKQFAFEDALKLLQTKTCGAVPC